MKTSNVYAKKIRELRLKSTPPLTQKELADRAGIHVNTLARAEKGAGIGVNVLERIAAALGMPAAYFLG